MNPALRDWRIGLAALAATAAAVVACWWLLAGLSIAQTFVCGVDGFGPAGGAWNAARLLSLSGMWTVMMGAMLVPAGTASSLLSPRGEDARRADEGATLRIGRPLIRSFGPPSPRGEKRDAAALSLSFLSGYLALLTVVGIVAAIGQWMLESNGLIGREAKIESPVLAGTLLAAVGTWHIAQLLCRHAPCGLAGDRQAHALLRGWWHGCSSLGCCLTMISVQFVGGAMNAVLMIGLTVWMLAEALLPWKRELAAATGIALITAGGLTIMGTFA